MTIVLAAVLPQVHAGQLVAVAEEAEVLVGEAHLLRLECAGQAVADVLATCTPWPLNLPVQ
jgi:hypothetical protein